MSPFETCVGGAEALPVRETDEFLPRFNRLWVSHQEAVLEALKAALYRYHLDPSQADDLCQDLYLKLIEDNGRRWCYDPASGPGGVAAYLRTAARRLVIDFARALRPKKDRAAGGEDGAIQAQLRNAAAPPASLAQLYSDRVRQIGDAVADAIARLGLRASELFYLTKAEGLKLNHAIDLVNKRYEKKFKPLTYSQGHALRRSAAKVYGDRLRRAGVEEGSAQYFTAFRIFRQEMAGWHDPPTEGQP